MLESRMSIEEISEADGDEAELDPSLLTEFQSEVDALVAAAEALGLDDPKFDGFEKVVGDKQNLQNNKLLVFSTFRHTLAYLERRLALTKVRLAVVHGGVPEDERRDMRARFKLPKEDPQALDVLLSSEVGTEGLDYQFCDALVNYDLPWNPMRIEQRIGRIDRRGQRSETVAIINMVTRGTVDAAIYTRCLYRIGVFQQALGGSEEILGELTREIRSIAENLALTEQERDERLRQLADNKLGRIHEQTQLEDQQAQLFGLAIRHAEDAGVEEATSPWLDPLKVANLVSAYLAGLDPDRQVAVGSKPVVTLRPKAEVREQLLQDAQASAMTGQPNSSWERWLKSSEPTRLLTVNPTEAEDRPNVELLGPSHPLVRAAAKWASLELEARFSLKVQTTSVAPGRYPVAIYGWNRLGVRDDYSIQAITPNPSLRPHLADLLTKATDNDSWVDPTSAESEECEEAHYAMWCDERADYQGQSRASIGAQLASLRTTNKARIAQLEEQLTANDDARIQKMRHSQIEAAERDFSRRVRALEEAGERSDVLFEPIAFGIIEVLEP
jgi:hypothetical protein